MNDVTKDQLPSSSPLTSGMTSLEAVLERACRQVLASFDLADSIDAISNNYGQNQAFNRAVALMGVSAKAGTALAKMKSEFRAKFEVTKRNIAPGADPALEAARRAGDEAYWARWEKTFAKAMEDDAAERKSEEGDPPQDSGGSNSEK
ncbi:MAG TPA: hypothetical protein VII56_07935 [Rhizomicrobium sp.]